LAYPDVTDRTNFTEIVTFMGRWASRGVCQATPAFSRVIRGRAAGEAEQGRFLKPGGRGQKAHLRQDSQGKGRMSSLVSLKITRNERKFQKGPQV
jgi:hypothetical protein